MNSIYYKDELHESQTNMLLNKFGLRNILEDVEYGSFSYLVAGTYKAEHIKKCIDDSNNINLDMLHETMSYYSSSEKNMINLGLQCFNSSLSNITLADAMRSVDDNNNGVIKQAINIRY